MSICAMDVEHLQLSFYYSIQLIMAFKINYQIHSGFLYFAI